MSDGYSLDVSAMGWVCLRCAALVKDKDVHSRFHDFLDSMFSNIAKRLPAYDPQQPLGGSELHLLQDP